MRVLFSRVVVCGGLAGLLCWTTPAAAGALTTVAVAGEQYECASRTAAQSVEAPSPPGEPEPFEQAPGLQVSICPAGELPLPRGQSGPPPYPVIGTGEGTTGAFDLPGTAPVEQYGADYYYAVEGAGLAESEKVSAFGGEASEQEEYVDPAVEVGHSITQLWALSERGNPQNFSDVEVGTITSALYNGGASTLFVYHFDEGQATCYNGCGFVQLSDRVGRVVGYPASQGASLLTVGSGVRYDVYRSATSGNWYVAIDGEVVGYFPPSAWSRRAPVFLTNLEAGGEVATRSPNLTPATTMGNGVFGAVAPAAGRPEGAYWRDITAEPNGTAARSLAVRPLAETSGVFTLGEQSGRAGDGPAGSNFRYGGTGWCAGDPGYCPPPTVTAEAPASIAAGEATLAATVDGRGLATRCWAEYLEGAWRAGARTTTPASCASSSGKSRASVKVTGLAATTSYSFRLVASNAGGTVYGGVKTFTTPAAPKAPPPHAPEAPTSKPTSTTPTPTPTATSASPVGAPSLNATPSVSLVSVPATAVTPAPAAALRLALRRVRVHRGEVVITVTTSTPGILAINGRWVRHVRSLQPEGSHVYRVGLRGRALQARARRRKARARRRILVLRVTFTAGGETVTRTVRVRL